MAPALVLLAAWELPAAGSLPVEPGYRGIGIAPPAAVFADRGRMVLAAELAGSGRASWIASLETGDLLVREGDGGPEFAAPGLGRGSIAALKLPAGKTKQIFIALPGGGIVSLDPVTGLSRLRSEAHAVSLAAGDFDGDGQEDLLAVLDGGGLLLLDGGSGGGRLVSELPAVASGAAASGNFLGLKTPQSALAVPGGATGIVDPGAGSIPALSGADPLDLAAIGWGVTGPDRLLGLVTGGDLLRIDPESGVTEWIDVGRAPGAADEVFLVLDLGLLGGAGPGGFIRGDANSDGLVDVSDAVSILGDLFLGRPAEAACRDALDANDDGLVDISDAIFSLGYLFIGGPPIPAPYPTPGPDPTPDSLPCML